MIVLLMGAPGAGKGTQGDLMVERKGFRKISTGDAFRSQIKRQTEIGMIAKTFMDKGHLVPNDVLLKILESEIGSDSAERILLDGYPRNYQQALDLDSKLGGTHKVVAVIQLNVEKDELIERLSGRRVCQNCGATYHVKTAPSKVDGRCDKCQGNVVQRVDDQKDKISVRLSVYENDTKPLVDFYRKRGVLWELNGKNETEAVYREIEKIVSSL